MSYLANIATIIVFPLLVIQIRAGNEQAKLVKNQVFISNAISILQLADQSLWSSQGGNRSSYLILIALQKEIKEQDLKNAIELQIKRITTFYKNSVMIPYAENVPVICQLAPSPCSKGLEPSKGFNAQNVIDHLDINRYSFWSERARAACLLRNIATAQGKEELNNDRIKKKKLYEQLIRIMQKENEPSLFVSRMALVAYSELTAYQEKNVFDFEGARKDWEKRREEILKINF